MWQRAVRHTSQPPAAWCCIVLHAPPLEHCIRPFACQQQVTDAWQLLPVPPHQWQVLPPRLGATIGAVTTTGSGKRDPPAVPRQWDAPLLTARIKRCGCARELQAVLADDRAPPLTPFHSSALLTHVAQLAERGGQCAELAVLSQHCAHLADEHLAAYDARGLANVVWALCTLGHSPSVAWLSRLEAVSAPQLRRCNSQQLANLLWALARWRHRPRPAWCAELVAASAAHLDGAAPQAAATLLWAAAHLRLSLSSEWVAAAQAACARTHRTPATDQALAMALWAVARLGAAPSAALVAALARQLRVAVQREPGSFRPQAVSCCLWALAALQHHDLSYGEVASGVASGADGNSAVAEQQQQWLRSSRGGSQAADARELSGAPFAWPCSRDGASADADTAADMLECVQLLLAVSKAQLPTFSAHGLSCCLWALAALQTTPPLAWQRAFWDAFVPDRLGPLMGQQVANVLSAVARLGLRPPPQWVDALICTSAGMLPSWDAHALSSALLALGMAGHAPPPSWLAAALAQLRRHAADCEPAALVGSLHALALLRQPPPGEWLRDVLPPLAACLQALPARQLVRSLWALARMRVSVPPVVYAAAEAALAASAPHLTLGEVAVALWVLPRLGTQRPSGTLATALLHRAQQELQEQEQDLRGAPRVDCRSLALLACSAAQLGGARAVPAVAAAVVAAARQAEHATGRDVAMLLAACAQCVGALRAQHETATQQQPAWRRLQRWPNQPQQSALLQRQLQQQWQQQQQAQQRQQQQQQQQRRPGELWASEVLPAGVAAQLVSRAGRLAALRRLRGRDCAVLAWAAARLQLQPGAVWLADVAAAYAAAGARGDPAERAPACDAAALMLWALARNGCHPGARWLDAHLAALEHCLPTLAPADMAAALQGLARLGYTPPARWVDAWARAFWAQLPLLQPRELSRMLESAGALRLALPAPWVARAAARVASQLPRLGGRALEAAVWGVARLGGGACAVPREVAGALMASLVEECGDALAGGSVPPASLVRLLEASGLLAGSLPSDPEWVALVLRRLTPCLTQLNGPQLAAVLGALRRLRCRPSDAWLAHTVTLVTHRAAERPLPPVLVAEVHLALSALRSPLRAQWRKSAALTYVPHTARRRLSSVQRMGTSVGGIGGTNTNGCNGHAPAAAGLACGGAADGDLNGSRQPAAPRDTHRNGAALEGLTAAPRICTAAASRGRAG